MKLSGKIILAVMLTCALATAHAQLQVSPDRKPQCVFGKAAQEISVVWHNAGDKTLDAEIRIRFYQTSLATVAPLKEMPWKNIEVLPGQTVFETAQMDFPAVNTRTRFLIQWLAGTNQVISKTEVLVYSTNLLGELKPLLGKENLGVLDPNDELKPLLKQNGVEFLDLGEMPLEDFSGRLAIIGPFESRSQMREGLAQTIKRIARKGVSMVWIQPPLDQKDEIKPSFYVVSEGRGAVVIAQSDLVAHFSEDPKSQLNLVYFCKVALNPEPFSLPNLTYQPSIK
jgi:hypothetical protein